MNLDKRKETGNNVVNAPLEGLAYVQYAVQSTKVSVTPLIIMLLIFFFPHCVNTFADIFWPGILMPRNLTVSKLSVFLLLNIKTHLRQS